MKSSSFVFIIFLLFFLSGCNITKGLKEGETLITKTAINYKKSNLTKNEEAFKTQLNEVITPKPNTGLFKSSVKIYQWGDRSTKEKGIRKWVQRNLGQAPSLYSDQGQVINRLKMKSMLKDNGFFQSDIEIDTTLKGKEVEIKYTIITEGQHKINNIYLPNDSTDLSQLILEKSDESLIKEGDFYNEILLAQERERINALATKYGYIDFDDSYIYYFVDTIPDVFLADIYFRIKAPEVGEVHEKYTIGKTVIYPNYNLSNNNKETELDTTFYKDDITIIEGRHLLDFKVLDRMVLQNEGDIIRKDLQDATISHLLDLGIFKFANMKFERQEDSLSHVLNRAYYLTPNFNQNISTNFELNNRTGGFYGISVSSTYQHKNIFKKAVTFSTSLSGGVETQFENNASLINTLDLNVEVSLSAPRFIIPFKLKPHSGRYVPRTNLSLGNNFQRRVGLYSINSANLTFGYDWKETSKKQHSLDPISINFVNILETSMEFDSLLNATPRLVNSFQNSFIAGLDYTYIYSNQKADSKKDYWYFKGNARTSGNLLSLVSETFGVPKTAGGQYQFFNFPFAQFVSLEADLRYYDQANENLFAYRISPAIGVAYGNSSVLPYIEQFFVGGSNSIRAFRIRELGPGSFVNDTNNLGDVDQQFIDQTGDIRLEMSAEYRFPILGFFKGAAFVDAGNVWLLKDDQTLGNNFDPTTFWKEIAIGAGIGLRIDIQYIVLRLDVATPIRKAYINEGFQWSLNRFEIGQKTWRKNNIIYNLAVGYPF